MAPDVYLAQALMGYEPIVDRRRNAIAMRFTIDAGTGARCLGGRARTSLLPALVPAFGMSIIHVDEDRRLKAEARPSSDARRSIPYVQEGIRSIATMDACFATGAHAIIGWLMEDALRQSGAANSNPDYLTIIELISMLDRKEDPAMLKSMIRRDAALAYKLLRFINLPGFGLAVECSRFGTR